MSISVNLISYIKKNSDNNFGFIISVTETTRGPQPTIIYLKYINNLIKYNSIELPLLTAQKLIQFIDKGTIIYLEKESNISFGLSYIRHQKIKENGVIFIIGSLKHILINEKSISQNGEVNLMNLDSIGVAGNNTYYKLNKNKTLDYIKKEKREILKNIVVDEKNKFN